MPSPVRTGFTAKFTFIKIELFVNYLPHSKGQRTKERSGEHNVFGFSKSYGKGSTPKIIKEMKLSWHHRRYFIVKAGYRIAKGRIFWAA